MARLHPPHLSNHVKHNPLPHRCCSRTHPEAGACGHRLLDLLRSPFAAARRLGSHIGRSAFPRRSHRRSRTLAPRRIGPPCGDIDLLRSRNAGISGCIPGVPAPSQQRGVPGGGPQGAESVRRSSFPPRPPRQRLATPLPHGVARGLAAYRPRSDRPGWSSGRRPSGQWNLRSDSWMGMSLMHAKRRRMRPSASNSQFSLPYDRNQFPASSCHS